MNAHNKRFFTGASLVFILFGLWSSSLFAQPEFVRTVAQTEWYPIPEQAPAEEGYVDVGGANLWYWDTGGDGEVVLLLHPLTGSAAIWGYQQPALVEAGYRVVAFSRRGHYRSETGPLDDTGTAVADIRALMDHLQIDRFHLVGSAGGGFIVPDYALTYPEQLISIVIATSTGGATDPQWRSVYDEMLRTEALVALPTWIKELGPSYRDSNPEGVAAWLELEELATPQGRIPQARVNDLSWDAISQIELPALLLTGDADVYMPPSRLLEYASYLPQAKVAIVSESGHSAYWEQPVAFNASLIDFLDRNRAEP